MQEAFLSAFEKIETYSGTVSFGAWLKKIVINRSLDAWVKERRSLKILSRTLVSGMMARKILSGMKKLISRSGQ